MNQIGDGRIWVRNDRKKTDSVSGSLNDCDLFATRRDRIIASRNQRRRAYEKRKVAEANGFLIERSRYRITAAKSSPVTREMLDAQHVGECRSPAHMVSFWGIPDVYDNRLIMICTCLLRSKATMSSRKVKGTQQSPLFCLVCPPPMSTLSTPTNDIHSPPECRNSPIRCALKIPARAKFARGPFIRYSHLRLAADFN